MERKRVKLEVFFDLDPVPGANHTMEDARDWLAYILRRDIPHYNPDVQIPTGDPNISPIERITVDCTCGQSNLAEGHFLRCKIWKSALGNKLSQ